METKKNSGYNSIEDSDKNIFDNLKKYKDELVYKALYQDNGKLKITLLEYLIDCDFNNLNILDKIYKTIDIFIKKVMSHLYSQKRISFYKSIKNKISNC